MSATIGDLLRPLNDQVADDARRTELLRPLLPDLPGTANGYELELRRSYLALDWLVRTYAPAFLELSDSLKAHAEALRALAPIINEASAEPAKPKLAAAWAAARAAAEAFLAPVVKLLQESAVDLVRRMIGLSWRDGR